MYSRFLAQFDREGVPVEAAARWFTGNPALEHVQDSESFVYRVIQGDRRYYLRVTREEHRTVDMILAELEFVEYLAGRGIAVSRPCASLAGRLVEQVESQGHTYFACMFAEAPGDRLRWKTANWNGESFRRWGAALGRIHAASTSFAAPRHRRFSWQGDDAWVHAEKYLPQGEEAARRELERVRGWLATPEESPGEFGMIHGDLCAANFHVSESDVTAFDFDDCCYHWFIYDIACAVAPAATRPAEERRPLRSAIVEGYRQTHALPADWETQFNWFLRMRQLYVFILNVRNWEGDMALHPKKALLDWQRKFFERPVEW